MGSRIWDLRYRFALSLNRKTDEIPYIQFKIQNIESLKEHLNSQIRNPKSKIQSYRVLPSARPAIRKFFTAKFDLAIEVNIKYHNR